MTNYDARVAEDGRLIILKALAGETSYSLNETLLLAMLETFGINRSRDWTRDQLKSLTDLDAVTIRQAGSVMIATITRRGLDHVERRTVIEKIARPSPES